MERPKHAAEQLLPLLLISLSLVTLSPVVAFQDVEGFLTAPRKLLQEANASEAQAGTAAAGQTGVLPAQLLQSRILAVSCSRQQRAHVQSAALCSHFCVVLCKWKYCNNTLFSCQSCHTTLGRPMWWYCPPVAADVFIA